LSHAYAVYIIVCVRFQYDPTKAAENLKKHGVSFADAEGVLQDPLAATVEDPDAKRERRFISLGLEAREIYWWLSGPTVAKMLV